MTTRTGPAEASAASAVPLGATPTAPADAPPVPADLQPGTVTRLSPLVRRVVAPNPGLMTGPGTNTYLVGADGEPAIVVDPGPDIEQHLDVVASCGPVGWIVVTHTHLDHSPGAPPLSERTGAPILAFAPRDGLGPDELLVHGQEVGDGTRLEAVHTPGHASNHLCFWLRSERLLFSGDHIMSGSTVVISPPDGDMAVYLESLRAVRRLDAAAIAPGHGSLITDPLAVIDGYLSHRLAREAQILDTLRFAGMVDLDALVAAVYPEIAPGLVPMAKRTAWAHLRKLAAEGRVHTVDVDVDTGAWAVVPEGA